MWQHEKMYKYMRTKHPERTSESRVTVCGHEQIRQEAYVATVHEESSISAQPVSRQVEQMRLGNHCVVQVERPLQV